jgi:predicted PurR-regulated permease PerM
VGVIQKQLVSSSGDIFSASQTVLKSAAEFSFSLILVFVISIYMLLYAESIGRIIRAWMPRGNGTAADDYPTTVQAAVAGALANR